jgi:Na+-transporting methylmalonyl-CoA/oxaloacetate decarboxylase gamma subunit
MIENPNQAAGRDVERVERMQRIRVGLTGLAVVLLIIALAAAMFRGVGEQAGSAAANNSAEMDASTTDEPLAELGVAPGAAVEDETANNSK